MEEFHRTQDQVPAKEVCSEDALKGEKEGDLGKSEAVSQRIQAEAQI